MIHAALQSLTNLLPSVCLLCRRRMISSLCQTCLQDLPWNHHPCQRCGLPLPDHASPVCGSCCTKPLLSFSVLAPMLYQPPIRELIHSYKFGQQTLWSKAFAQIMADYIDAQPHAFMPDAFLAVPLHKTRLLERGFNQADLLAQHLGRALNTPLIYFSKRVKNTLAQHGLKKSARTTNLRAAFQVSPKIQRYGNIALIDDILTTGATLGALGEAIIKQHPKVSLQAWCLARAF